MGKVFELRGNNRPLLVTFGNLVDPKRVKRVDPGALSETFGPGYALKSITIEKSDEDVELGRVEALLPWLQDYFSRQMDGNRYHTIEAADRFANSLDSGWFATTREDKY